jgi:hypothetical protein
MTNLTLEKLSATDAQAILDHQPNLKGFVDRQPGCGQ